MMIQYKLKPNFKSILHWTIRQRPKFRNWESDTVKLQPLPSQRQQPATRNQHTASSNWQPKSRIQDPGSSNQHPATRDTQCDFGFTLLEVLIALAIMAIVLVAVYRLHSQTLSMEAANRFYTQAPLLAQSKMAQLEASSSEVVAGDSGDFGEKFPGYSWSVSTEEISAEALGEDAEDLKRIDVTVSLNEDEYEYTVRSYLLLVK
jgi:general secretion pathway protein I